MRIQKVMKVLLKLNHLNSAPGGDLQTLMDDDMVPYERDAVKFVRQVLEGLFFLHERNVAHLDIKVRQLALVTFNQQLSTIHFC